MNMRLKYITILISLAIYAWFVGWCVFALLGISGVVLLSYRLPKKWNLLIPLTCLIAGFILMKYLLSNMGKAVPIGYSVFMFNCISFLVDYSKEGNKDKVNSLDLLCYLFFFPKMLCGPFIKFSSFQAQLNKWIKPSITNVYRAFKISVFAAFCKFAIADNLSVVVASQSYGINTFFGSVLFALQLYLDFYAYSNFAIALALLFGIELPTSFNTPYRSVSFRDFWGRWNITISEWLKEYIYIPLGGNRVKNRFRNVFNTLTTFIVSGLWHGASLPFILWGGLHGLLVITERLLIHRLESRYLLRYAYNFFVFISVAMLWQLFRMDNFGDLRLYLSRLFTYAPLDLAVLAYVATIGIVVWSIDSQAIQKLVFMVSNEKQYVYREVSLVCGLLTATILLSLQPSINFFYFRF